jgi:hypothetical protein
LVADTTVAIISCCARESGISADINSPNVAKAWYMTDGARLCDPTIPSRPTG